MARSENSHPRRSHGWSRSVIRIATAISMLSLVGLAGGFAYGAYAAFGGAVAGQTLTVKTVTNPSETQSTPSQGVRSSSGSGSKTLHLVALGDSLTHGFGDASGQGYVGDVTQLFRHSGVKVIQSNLGIDGLTSSGLLTELSQTSVQSLIRSANVILISIGGNDLNNAAGLPSIQMGRILRAESQFSSNLTAILSDIRRLNSKAPIALIGLYNPYSNVTQTARQTDAIVQAWDVKEDTIAALFPKTVVVQTFDLFQLYPNKFLYVDHFHPNQAGYQRIAERVWQDVQQQ